MKRRKLMLWALGVVLLLGALLLVAPIAQAATNTEQIATFVAYLEGNTDALKAALKSNLERLKMVYCAQGSAAVC